MHILDGWLSLEVILLGWVITLSTLMYSFFKLKEEMSELKFVQMGIIGAVIFVAQMVNFPVGPGISGHLLGGALAALIVGPYAAVFVLTAVLIVQAFFFADGGILSLGVNIFNMGIIGAFLAYYLMQLMYKFSKNHRVTYYLTSFSGGFLAVVIASVFAALELFVSGRIDVIGIGLIIGWHIAIGIGEGLITTGIIAYLNAIEFPLKNTLSTVQEA